MSKEELKKKAKNAKQDFALHVLLLQKNGLTKAEAVCAAYVEGPLGLIERMSPGLFAPKGNENAKA